MRADILIVGAGIAGASLAAELAPHASVLLLEAEDQPGHHSTGRSAAFWSESYGGKPIQPLTCASGDFLAAPPPDFFDRSFLSPQGAIHLARNEARGKLDALKAEFGDTIRLDALPEVKLLQAVPGLRQGWRNGLAEPGCQAIDVAALHGAYLAAFRRAGGRIATGARVTAIRREGGGWKVEAGNAGDAFSCATLVNAAGAWADDVARLAGVEPLGIVPHRRAIVQLRTDPPAPERLPLVKDIEGGFYFKGEAGGRLWLSPQDETPCTACDAAPEEIDIALAIDRLQQVVDWRIARVERSWAGLRSFAPDRLPIYGYDAHVPGFFWCAGQGGFGIQTAPAAAKMAARLALGNAQDPMVAHIDAEPYAPERFNRALSS